MSAMRVVVIVWMILVMSLVGVVESWGSVKIEDVDSKTQFEWLLLGVFPNDELPKEKQVGGNNSAGLDIDYLSELGGEANATIGERTGVRFVDEAGKEWVTTSKKVGLRNGDSLSFGGVLKDSGRRVAYAYTEIEAEKEQQVEVFFGSDDRAKVWVNGEMVHEFRRHGRGINVGDDQFSFTVKEGVNRVLVKVENDMYGWGFGMKLVPEGKKAEMLAEMEREQLVERLLWEKIRYQNPWGNGYVLNGPNLLPMEFDNPELAKKVLGDYAIEMKWFDRELNEVEKASEEGVYWAWVNVKGEDGFELNQVVPAVVLYKWVAWSRYWGNLNLSDLNEFGVSGNVLGMYDERVMRQFYGGLVWGSLLSEPQGIQMLNGLLELSRAEGEGRLDEYEKWETPWMLSQDQALKLRMKVEGREAVKLEYPKVVELEGRGGVEVHEGTLAEAGFDDGFKEAMGEVCQKWAEESGVPFNVMVVRNGVVAYEGAHYGAEDAGIEKTTTFEVASISKLMFSTVLSMFRYQGLVELDEPIGKYIEGFDTEGEKAITVRQCMMHLAGMEGHVNYGGMPNVWFDDAVKNRMDSIYPSVKYTYNGLSLNLVGRVCELVGGESFGRMMQEHLWVPLGCEESESFDTAGGTHACARDLARVGQMLLNGGTYGDLQFFDVKTRDEMLPVRVGDVFKGTITPEVEYGLGTEWFRDVFVEGEAGELVFGERMFGHGSATASIIRVDLDNGLVVTMARPLQGSGYNEHYQAMFKTIGRYMQK
ncbi:beta-lactamase family protein [Planctomycetota bacterium]|nr:beta-lactamase family protein [Planctomycetota bacterium]